MKIKKQYNESIPEYSLSYLINSDSSGITREEMELIDNYMQTFYNIAEQYNNGNITISIHNNQEVYFTKYPAFGLPCNCFDVIITILV